MANLAIKGHPTKGKEVIEILEMFGGKNRFYYDGRFKELIYTIGSELELDVFNINSPSVKNDYAIFSLEEFLEKFPYKVGDKVIAPSHNIHTIESIHWSSDKIYYNTVGEGFNTSYTAKDLQPYKEQEETMEKK